MIFVCILNFGSLIFFQQKKCLKILFFRKLDFYGTVGFERTANLMYKMVAYSMTTLKCMNIWQLCVQTLLRGTDIREIDVRRNDIPKQFFHVLNFTPWMYFGHVPPPRKILLPRRLYRHHWCRVWLGATPFIALYEWFQQWVCDSREK